MLPDSTSDTPVNRGYYLIFEFTKEIKIDSIKISNGYLKSPKLYQLNNRTINYKLTFFPGSIYLSCVDKFGLQTFEIDRSLKELKVEIESYTQGDWYNDHCISEIQLFHKGKNILNTQTFKIKNEAGWYSSDRITCENGKIIDLVDFDSGNGLTNPLISKNRRFLLYTSGDDGCSSEIVDTQEGVVLQVGDYLMDNRLCPSKWLSNTTILVNQLSDSFEETGNEYIVDIMKMTKNKE